MTIRFLQTLNFLLALGLLYVIFFVPQASEMYSVGDTVRVTDEYMSLVVRSLPDDRPAVGKVLDVSWQGVNRIYTVWFDHSNSPVLIKLCNSGKLPRTWISPLWTGSEFENVTHQTSECSNVEHISGHWIQGLTISEIVRYQVGLW